MSEQDEREKQGKKPGGATVTVREITTLGLMCVRCGDTGYTLPRPEEPGGEGGAICDCLIGRMVTARLERRRVYVRVWRELVEAGVEGPGEEGYLELLGEDSALVLPVRGSERVRLALADADREDLGAMLWRWGKGRQYPEAERRDEDGRYNGVIGPLVLGNARRFRAERRQMEEPRLEVDHLDGNIYDNRSRNLRLATRRENGGNMAQWRKGRWLPKGICLVNGRFRARIGHQSRINLGVFPTLYEACRKRDAALRAMYGEGTRVAGLTEEQGRRIEEEHRAEIEASREKARRKGKY